ncbi:hypothetical protein GDO86_014653 [Hymenochirus boettgeri]|uniref:Bcl-2 Bcl-2 homology region 1-3 domain-containing protein n=1 Tax=Hymenochirus boettgeri TaxID=247094 RepID=A0A8T2JY43_9PIPI|nr:hypothetical protein GDO86_014653 [Hymenochirus boettgeri]
MESSVLLALQDASDEFELRYQRAFNDLTSQLHITQDTAYQSFQQVVGELFRDGTNWGRIVAFLAFGRALCGGKCKQRDDRPAAQDCSMDGPLSRQHTAAWIQDNGGWEGFVTLYGKDAAARSRKSQERFGRWMVTIMPLAGVFFLFSYLSRR